MQYNDIVIFGISHWISRGNLNSPHWEWGLEINKLEIPPECRLYGGSLPAKNFIQEFKLYLPEDYASKIQEPNLMIL